MKYFITTAVSFILAFAVVAPLRGAEEDEDNESPINERVTAQAWAALRAGDNREAVEKANECLDRFQQSADTIQSILEQQNATLPTGDVSGEERERLYRYQILHDVATCLLIKARAEEKLGQRKDAAAVKKEAGRYTYARIKNRPDGPYWSPAEISAEILERSTP